MAAPQNKLDRARRLLLRAVDLVSDDDAGSNRELSTASLSPSRASSSATVPLGGQGCEESRVKYPHVKTVLQKSRRSSNGCSGLIEEREESERQPQLRQVQQ